MTSVLGELRIDGLAVERGGQPVLADLSFVARAGEALLLLGPNGAGKTTLLRTLAGFMSPSAGSMTMSGLSPDEAMSEHTHFIGHQNGIKARMTVRENLEFWQVALASASRPGTPGPADAVDTALSAFDLLDLADVETGYLSAGQKRRAALARLLVAPRRVWLLDEPTVSLDARTTAAFAGIVDRHLADGGIVIAATHLPLGLGHARELRLGERVASA